MYKKTYTVEILFDADKEYELGDSIFEAIENTLNYADVIQGYDLNINLESNII